MRGPPRFWWYLPPFSRLSGRAVHCGQVRFFQRQPAFSVKAGDRSRTDDIQLGKLTTHPHNSLESPDMTGSADPPRSSHSSRNEKGPIDDDLTRLIEAWPCLPSPIQAAILALLDSTQAEARK